MYYFSTLVFVIILQLSFKETNKELFLPIILSNSIYLILVFVGCPIVTIFFLTSFALFIFINIFFSNPFFSLVKRFEGDTYIKYTG